MEQQEHVKNETEHEVRNSINKKRPGGRPKLTPDERRSIQIKIGYTEAQAIKLSERAEAAGVGDVEFIRRLSLNQPFYSIPAINRQALIDLNKIGTNINQLARVANSTTNHDFSQAVTALKNELERVGKRIGGAE